MALRTMEPSDRRRVLVLVPLALVAISLLTVGGVKGRTVLALQASTTAPARTRVGVVDLATVVRAHPRWSEFNAISAELNRIESQLAQVPPPPPPPRTDVQRILDQEVARLRGEFTKEIDFLRQESARRFSAFATTVREEQQAKFEAMRTQLEAEARTAIGAKHEELQAQLRRAEQEIMDEYAYPILNLRLRVEVAGLSSDQEGRAILRQIQALQEEREERIRAKTEEFDKALREFQKAKEDEVNVRLDALRDSLYKEAQARLADKQAELQAEFTRSTAEKEQQFRRRLDRRRAELIAVAEAQVRSQQQAYLKGLDGRAGRLRDELAALQDQRARLEASVLADVKVTVAAIAQEQKLDVVLTRYVANISGINITSALVQRLKR